ncbi:MAG: hypothetical protein A3A80_00605 [Candidatus Terrybacteria bacterium RIFCSPLOWO2_01_FULL_44_24]|nr:MAG: hypothetical protein A3B75_02315 [Candidatus Terrybacteria bacterium RIFCSPHIGHO2_02_FULL_43_14]OHA51428.1 MAG: hypothetical protein A3A80_00605 [Candidatus Terrybacteria bacterium RIFCSPLOWO2_01_FULL_44_24]
MVNRPSVTRDPTISHLEHHLAPAMLQWQCERCLNSEGVEGKFDGRTGTLEMGPNNDLYVVKFLNQRDRDAISKTYVVYHVNRSLVEELQQSQKNSGQLSAEERRRLRFGCGGQVKFFSFGQEGIVKQVICKPDEERVRVLSASGRLVPLFAR